MSSISLSKANTGNKNPSFGKHWFKDPKSLKSKLFFNGDEPKGWIKGKHVSENDFIATNTENVSGPPSHCRTRP